MVIHIPGTSFNRIFSVYEFDRRMRSLLLALMEGLETKLRAHIAYYHAHRYGALGYLYKQNLNSKHKSEKFEKHVKGLIEKNSQASIVRHHNEQYGGRFPIWVIVELFTFGTLSLFYSDMKREDQKTIAKSLFERSDTELRSWLFCLTHLRNACTHYSRLYFTLFPARPTNMRELKREMNRRLFDYILISKALCKGTAYWDNEFLPSFIALMKNQDCIQLEHIGFPENWFSFFS